MQRLKFYFTYDGTPFRGLQRQKNTDQTIQEVFESKLSQLVSQKVNVLSSGRTDAGVHARIQVAHADVPKAFAQRMLESTTLGAIGLHAPRLLQSLNSLLPRSIRILKIEKADQRFHAIADVKKKTYVYFIDPSFIQLPELRTRTWNLRLPLHWDAMFKATKALQGTHDFNAFCSADATVKNTVRTVFEARWGEVDYRGFGAPSVKLMAFRITGSGFVKNMVRSIVGTLVHIGGGKGNADLIAHCLTLKKRTLAGPTAPPQGLWVWDVLY
jgi:tRNA pseudouridine38-40 synthase